MKRKFLLYNMIVLFVLLVASVGGLFACGGDPAPSHTHEYVYTDNGNGTHSGVCSCGNVKPYSQNEHDFAGENGECSVCGHKHVLVAKETEDLSKHDIVCSACNLTYSSDLPHDDKDGVCSSCGHVHEFALSFDEEGHFNVCSTCGYTQEKTAHTEVLTSDGEYHWVYCSFCDYAGEKQSHVGGEKKTENEVPAACDHVGGYDEVVYCTVCGEELSRESFVLPKTEHDYKAEITPPTCTERGFTTYTCSVCNYAYTGDFTAEKGHTEGETAFDGANHWKICSVCGEKFDVKSHVLSARDLGTSHERYCSCGYVEDSAEHNANRKENGAYYCSICSHEHVLGEFDDEGFATCSVCGKEIKIHTHDYVWTDNGDGTHSKICSCGEVLENTTLKHDSKGENYVCSRCGHAHNPIYADNGETHILKCETCPFTFGDPEPHDNNGGKCSLCGHAHDFVAKDRGENHAFVCSCGIESGSGKHNADKIEDDGYYCSVCLHKHTLSEFDGEGLAVCTVCNTAVRKHEHAFVWTDNGNGTHSRICSCGKIMENSTENHTFGDFDDEGVATCTLCGARQKTHEHAFVWTDNGDGTHSRVCSCGKVLDGTIGSHDFNGANGACSVCGHQHVIAYSDNGINHKVYCSACNLEKTYGAHDNENGACSVCGHQHIFAAHDKGANHETECSVCGLVCGAESHDANGHNGADFYCTVCGHEHVYSGFDENGYAICSICGTGFYAHTHNYVWTDNGDGTHSEKCSCGKVLDGSTGSHDFNGANGTCSSCGHKHELTVVKTAGYHTLSCTVCNLSDDSEEHKSVLRDFGDREECYCTVCGYELYSFDKSFDRVTLDLNITNGVPSSENTQTFNVPAAAGNVLAATYNGKYLGATSTVTLKNFGLNYGEGNVEITTKTVADGRTHVLKYPVLLVTKMISGKADLINFRSYSDAYNGVKDDGIYDGYFMLKNNVNFNAQFTTTFVSTVNDTSSDGLTKFNNAVGFKGVFDGNGKTINGLTMYSATNPRLSFITKLATSGVIKNVFFDNASVGGCAYICAGGTGTVEDVYIRYKYYGSNSNGSAYSKLDSYTTTFMNVAGSSNTYLHVNRCVIDLTQELGYTKRITNSSMGYNNYGYILERAGWRDEDGLSEVFIVGATEYTRYFYVYNQEEGRNMHLTRPISHGSWDYSYNASDFITLHGAEIGEWEGWDYSNGTVYFNGSPMISGTPSALSTGGRLIVPGDKSSDYTIVYEPTIKLTMEAASFFAKSFYAATGVSERARLYEDPATADYTRNGVYFKETITDGITLNRIGSAVWDDSACYIVIGNKAILSELNVVPDEYCGIIRKVGNSYILAADREDDYDELVRVLLSELVGFSALSDNLVNYDVSKAVGGAPEVDYIFTVGSSKRTSAGGIQYFKYDQLGYSNNSYTAIGGNTWHNTFNWLPFATFVLGGGDYGVSGDASHWKWYSNYVSGVTPTSANAPDPSASGHDQLCYTAHGDSVERNLMIEAVGNAVAEFLLSDRSIRSVTFTHQDNAYFCTCSSCSGKKPSLLILKLVNEVCNYIDEHYDIPQDWSLSFFAYKKTMEAPTEAEFGSVGSINSHVGIVIAPIEAHYAKSVYDSSNAWFKSSMEAWGKHIGNVGCWFYQANFGSYFFQWNTFKPMLTWIEYAASVLHTNTLFIQGISSVITGSAFNDFKEYITSRAGVEIMSRVDPRSSYASETLYMADIDKYYVELVQDFFGIVISGSTVTLNAKKNGYYGPAGVEMYELFCAQNAWYDSALAQLKSDVDSGYTKYDNKRYNAWAAQIDSKLANHTGYGSCRDQVGTCAFLSRSGSTYRNIIHSAMTYLYSAGTDYYSNVYYPYVTKAQVTNFYAILARATKKLSDAYSGNYDDPYYDMYNDNIMAESLFSRLVACTANVNITSTTTARNITNTYGMKTLYYTYTFKGITTTETAQTKWQHFKDDMDHLCLDRLAEDFAVTGVYNLPQYNGTTRLNSGRAGVYYIWSEMLNYIDGGYTVPTWVRG